LWSSLPEEHETYPNLLEDHGYYVGSYSKGFRPGKNRRRNEVGKEYESFEEFFEQRPSGRPFCFWYGSKDPHRPYQWQSGVRDGCNPDDVVVPPFLPDVPVVRTDFCDYYWEVQRFDREIGRQIELLREHGELDNTIIVITSDNGCPFPRAKCNMYDYGTHVPLAIQWNAGIPKGLVLDDFVSLIDLAPTFLEVAGVQIPDAVTGRSLTGIFETGRVTGDYRNQVLFGKERHTPSQSDSMAGYPMRAIRTREFLYIRNFEPERWPAGAETSIRGPAYSDIDASPTKSYILDNRDDKNVAVYFELACGKRPAEELYDLSKDPNQLNNVANEQDYFHIKTGLRKQLMSRLRDSGDPRVSGDGNLFDNYPYYGPVENGL
jgi:arylsulfatase A-like enzyme